MLSRGPCRGITVSDMTIIGLPPGLDAVEFFHEVWMIGAYIAPIVVIGAMYKVIMNLLKKGKGSIR